MPVNNVDPVPRTYIIPTASNNVNDPGTRQNQPYFVDMVTTEMLFLQMVPLELTYAPETEWNTIVSPGRNTPLYQFTGGEDTWSFSISWYANEESRQDVLRKCKWIEALSKSNAYKEKPHRVKFIMGDLFLDAIWIVFSAPYKISLFNRTLGMLPQLATQEITLKRVMTLNRTSAQIRKIDT